MEGGMTQGNISSSSYPSGTSWCTCIFDPSSIEEVRGHILSAYSRSTGAASNHIIGVCVRAITTHATAAMESVRPSWCFNDFCVKNDWIFLWLEFDRSHHTYILHTMCTSPFGIIHKDYICTCDRWILCMWSVSSFPLYVTCFFFLNLVSYLTGIYISWQPRELSLSVILHGLISFFALLMTPERL